MALDPAWVALIGTVCGGVGLKVAEHWLGRNKVRNDDATQIRDELRLEIAAQKEEIRQLEAQVDVWRKEYYDLRDKYILEQTQMKYELQKITHEAERLRSATQIVAELPPAHAPVVDTPPSNTAGP